MEFLQIPVKVRPIKISGSVYVNVPRPYLEYLKKAGVELREANLQITEEGGRLGLHYEIMGG
jgi:hypothetical protein